MRRADACSHRVMQEAGLRFFELWRAHHSPNQGFPSCWARNLLLIRTLAYRHLLAGHVASNKSHVIPISESLPASAVSPIQGLRIPPSRPPTSCLCLWLHSGQSTCLLSIWRTERCSILTYTIDP